MMLSRIAEHLKHQNWTAVGLDFLIVVVGVFIGTNVTNWNDARKSHIRAQVYSERLVADLHFEYEYSLALHQYVDDTMAAGHSAFAGLTGSRPVDDRTILIDAFRATQFQWNEGRRAAYEELVSSGSLDLIADTALRDIAVRYYGTSATVVEQTLADMRDSQYRTLFHESIDPDVEAALRRDCGDRHYVTPGGVGGVFEIGYDCTAALTVDDATVARAVAALRAASRVLPLLRQQVAIYDTERANIDYMIEDTGLQSLFVSSEARPKAGSLVRERLD